MVRSMEDCIRDIRSWMLNNNLKLNDVKTEFLIIGTPQQLEKLDNISIRVGDSDISAPIVPILKPDGFSCICGDYKTTVNQVSKLDSYPSQRLKTFWRHLEEVKNSPNWTRAKPTSSYFWKMNLK